MPKPTEVPTHVELFIPDGLLQRVMSLKVDGAVSRNARLVALIEDGLLQAEALADVAESERRQDAGLEEAPL